MKKKLMIIIGSIILFLLIILGIYKIINKNNDNSDLNKIKVADTTLTSRIYMT